MADTKEMSGAERYSWAALIATSVVSFHFIDRMYDGFAAIEHGAGDLLGVYLRVIFMFITLHVVILTIFAIKRGDSGDDDPYERDERDKAIERKSDRAASLTLSIIVKLVIFVMLFENAYPDKYDPPLSMSSPSGIFFALMGAILLADIIKRVMMISSYRA